MSPLDEILAQPTGARFFRADLHIHSLGASHDVKDSAMTAAAIVATAGAPGNLSSPVVVGFGGVEFQVSLAGGNPSGENRTLAEPKPSRFLD